MGETETALDALQKLARDLVAHDVCLAFIAFVQFLARRALVDPYHGNANGPGSIQGFVISWFFGGIIGMDECHLGVVHREEIETLTLFQC